MANYVLLNDVLVCISVLVKFKLPQILSEVVLQTKNTKHFFIMFAVLHIDLFI